MQPDLRINGNQSSAQARLRSSIRLPSSLISIFLEVRIKRGVNAQSTPEEWYRYQSLPEAGYRYVVCPVKELANVIGQSTRVKY